MAERERAERMLAVRVSTTDIERLDAVVRGTSGLFTRHALARTALRIGLEAIEQDRTILLGQPVPKRGGVRTRRPKPRT